jgi:arginine utilization protein RocB
MPSLAERARWWALWLTRQPTVTGSPGEIALPGLLAAAVRATPALSRSEVFTIPAADDRLGRAALGVLVRGTGRQTALLTGHFDTVSYDDYGDLAMFATEPERLAPALIARLADARTPAERLAHADLARGAFLPGRGLLDMKAGLAAGLATLEGFASDPHPIGNLLFVAVPDEEVSSVGARALANWLVTQAPGQGLDVTAAINLDCIGDPGDGSVGSAIALGSVGKVLLTATVFGVPAHASHPYLGLNPAALAGALAARLEWAHELADGIDGGPGIPPTLLSLKDDKTHYDVTMPGSAVATWNVLSHGRPFGDILATFEQIVRATVSDAAAQLAARQAALTGGAVVTPAIDVLWVSALLRAVDAATAGAALVQQAKTEAAARGLDLPLQSALITRAAWAASGRRGAAVVLGCGSLPYPTVRLTGDDQPAARRLRAAIDDARATMAAAGSDIGIAAMFPGISDMSFLGEGDAEGTVRIAEETPAWDQGVRWNRRVAGIPTVNIGPWGRDYHTPLERVHTGYAFDVLPRLLTLVVGGVLAPERAGAAR